jgi:preprotein translocase subunit SecG
MLYTVLMVIHLLVCFGLITVVLVQSGKGGGLAGGAFGGSAQTVFGGRGANDFITRATMIFGGLFFLTSLVLALISTKGQQSSRSLLQEEARRAAASAPAQVPSGSQPAKSPGGTLPPAPQAPAPAPSGGK